MTDTPKKWCISQPKCERNQSNIKQYWSDYSYVIFADCPFWEGKVNSYYTFSKKPTGTNYTIKDIEPILLKNCPVQLTINNKVVWDDKYNDCDDYDMVIATYANHEVLELWLSTVDHHHSLVKITTRENNNGT